MRPLTLIASLTFVSLLPVQTSQAQTQPSQQSAAAPAQAEHIRLWSSFGDPYPTGPRQHEGITNFLLLVAPGNANPGNLLNLRQDDPGLRIPMELKKYIARQFRYVVFDQESYAPRASAYGPPTALIPPVYHEEAQALMELNKDMIVFPYFCFTLVRQLSPHWEAVQKHESWILHSQNPSNDPGKRIRATENGFYMMDPGNTEWRTFYVDYINTIVRKYNYRGVMLDNMTPFPWVSPEDRGRLDPAVRSRWFRNLQRFLTALKRALPASVTVICNSLSLDPVDTKLPLWGASGGTAIMPFCDGGMSESFHFTGWSENLHRQLDVMKRAGTMNKLFLVTTHYTRGEDKDLARLFGLAPDAWTADPGPPLATFHEMHMSYLARFLLGIPERRSSLFGFSFTPGTTLYQYIPYYALWDEDFGVPLTAGYDVRGSILQRRFSRCIVYVNDAATSTTVTLPGDSKWLKIDYSQARQGGSSATRRMEVTSVTLRERQGVILFKR